jgi:hypothetical protein
MGVAIRRTPVDRRARKRIRSRQRADRKVQRMTAIIGRVRAKWSSARERRKSRRRERSLKHVEARADRDRYRVRGREGGGGGSDGGMGGGGA